MSNAVLSPIERPDIERLDVEQLRKAFNEGDLAVVTLSPPPDEIILNPYPGGIFMDGAQGTPDPKHTGCIVGRNLTETVAADVLKLNAYASGPGWEALGPGHAGTYVDPKTGAVEVLASAALKERIEKRERALRTLGCACIVSATGFSEVPEYAMWVSRARVPVKAIYGIQPDDLPRLAGSDLADIQDPLAHQIVGPLLRRFNIRAA